MNKSGLAGTKMQTNTFLICLGQELMILGWLQMGSMDIGRAGGGGGGGRDGGRNRTVPWCPQVNKRL